MCEYCHETPHLSRCPNALQPIVGKCELCKQEIYDYERYFKLGEFFYCGDCVDKNEIVAEV
jgi:hypothetical protein